MRKWMKEKERKQNPTQKSQKKDTFAFHSFILFADF